MEASLHILPTPVLADILSLVPPATTLVARGVCKAFNANSPAMASMCIDVSIGHDGRVTCEHPARFPACPSIRLRVCMQHMCIAHQGGLRASLVGVLERFPAPVRLRALEIRGALSALILCLEVMGSYNVHVTDATLVRKERASGLRVDSRLSDALAALVGLQRLRLEGVSINTMRLQHLTDMTICSITRMDAIADFSSCDWDGGSLARLRSLQAFDICSPHDPHACRMLALMSNLESLTLFSTVRPDILASLTSLTFLHISTLPSNDQVLPGLLHLKANRISDAQCSMLRTLTPNLERLEFRCCGQVGVLLSRLPTSLVSISPMTSLSGHDNQLQNLCGISRLSLGLSYGHPPAILHHLTALTRFTLTANDFRVATNLGDLARFLRTLHSSSRLVHLKLASFDFTHPSLLRDLSGLTGLTCLELGACVCTRAALMEGVTALPRLRSLHLKHCEGVSREDAQRVEHHSGASLKFRVEFEGRVPFCPWYRFA